MSPVDFLVIGPLAERNEGLSSSSLLPRARFMASIPYTDSTWIPRAIHEALLEGILRVQRGQVIAL